MTIDPSVQMRRAAVFSGAGLTVQLGASFHWTPATFILSAAVGLPLVAIGVLLFARAVYRIMKNQGAL